MALGDQLGFLFPNFASGSIVSVITITILIILFAILVSVALFLGISYYRYRYKIRIFEKLGKSIEPTKTDRAMAIRLGEAGDTVFYTRKYKKYLPSPSIQTGRNTYWFYIREDGEWINIGIGDIDQQMREVKAHFLDKEIRYARAALQKNFKDRYQKLNFLEKYGGLIAYTGLIAITGVMVWLSLDKFLEVTAALGNAVQSAAQVNEKTAELIAALNDIRSTGGLTPA